MVQCEFECRIMASKLQAIANASPEDLETSLKAAAQRFGFSELKKQQKKVRWRPRYVERTCLCLCLQDLENY